MSVPFSIAFLDHSTRLGGAQRSLLDLLAELDRDVHVPSLLLPGDGPFEEAARALDVPVRHVPELGTLRRRAGIATLARDTRRLWRGMREVVAAMAADPPALVHANSTTAALFALRTPPALGTPLVWHLRDLAPLGVPARLLRRRTSTVVAVSGATQRLLQQSGLRDKSVLVHNGIRFEPERPQPPASDEDMVLVVGQRVPWKGHELAVDVAAALCPRNPRLRFLLVAPRPSVSSPGSLPDLEQTIRDRGLADRVRVTGEREDVSDLLAKSRVLLHPAWPEPFGRVVVEAMAAGRPVVAFGGDHGPAEILRHDIDGLLVNPRNAGALADALQTLLADPERARRMGQAGRERALARFGSARMAEDIQSVYARLLHDRGRR